jgi:hypothetical protein
MLQSPLSIIMNSLNEFNKINGWEQLLIDFLTCMSPWVPTELSLAREDLIAGLTDESPRVQLWVDGEVPLEREVLSAGRALEGLQVGVSCQVIVQSGESIKLLLA